MKHLPGVILAACAALWLGAIPAAASPILIDPDGAGPSIPVSISQLDPGAGNVITNQNSASGVGTVGTFLYQANLATSFGVCTANCFTFTAGLTHTITQIVNNPDGSRTQTFAMSPVTNTNFFEIWYNPTTPGNDLTGDCYRGICTVPGSILVLRGVFLSDGSYSSTMTNLPTTIQPLDQFGADNYAGKQTITATGGIQGNIGQFSVIHPLFFPLGVSPTTILAFSSGSMLPFRNVDPSGCFFGGPVAGVCPGVTGVANTGVVNGLAIPGPNGNSFMQYQTNAEIRIGDTSQVPEPATMALLGIGLAAGVARRRPRQPRS